jgi:deoxyribodipyrimidine photo-lyase
MIYDKSIFIFRRDLRIDDNIGLYNALKMTKHVIPIFIFTEQISNKNKVKSNNAVEFMIESLEDLNSELKKKKSKLYYFCGEPNKIIQKIIDEENIEAVFFNMDYTNYAKKRDLEIEILCSNNNIACHIFEDALLFPIGNIKNNSGGIYYKFTPFYNKSIETQVSEPITNKLANYYNGKINYIYKKNIHDFYKSNLQLSVHGGRQLGLQILKLSNNYKKYNDTRNILSIKTTGLSAYIKFGCLSPREIYYNFKKNLGIKNDLIKQLMWRDFYYNVAYNEPRILPPNKESLKVEYDNIKWVKDKNLLNAWKNGKTGFPLVDACMKELNNTGFMHNRGRLVVSCFLVKTLGIDWKEGEKYFAQKLVDYDSIVNLSNWQWVGSMGVDSQPFFRIFNPWLQSKKFDKNCIYIKQWLPELNDVPNDEIHEWFKYYNNYKKIKYSDPIIDYAKSKSKILKMYKDAIYLSK